jgi:hypothetical protein
VKESINRLNGLLKAKECIRDIHSVINDLEKDIERSIRLDCALLLKDDDFTSVHGNLHGCNDKPKIRARARRIMLISMARGNGLKDDNRKSSCDIVCVVD